MIPKSLQIISDNQIQFTLCIIELKLQCSSNNSGSELHYTILLSTAVGGRMAYGNIITEVIYLCSRHFLPLLVMELNNQRKQSNPKLSCQRSLMPFRIEVEVKLIY